MPHGNRPRGRGGVWAQLPFSASQAGSHFPALTNISFDGEPSRPALRVQAPGGTHATDCAPSHGAGRGSQQPSKEPARGHSAHDLRSYHFRREHFRPRYSRSTARARL